MAGLARGWGRALGFSLGTRGSGHVVNTSWTSQWGARRDMSGTFDALLQTR